MKGSFVVTVLIAVIVTVVRTQTASDYRLGNEIKPSRYLLHVKPNFVTQTFVGSVNITLSVNQTTNSVILNAHETLHVTYANIFQNEPGFPVVSENGMSVSLFIIFLGRST